MKREFKLYVHYIGEKKYKLHSKHKTEGDAVAQARVLLDLEKSIDNYEVNEVIH